MAIPELTDKGLLPQGIYDSSFQEIENRFAVNALRKDIYNKLIAALIEIRQLFRGNVIYVDGGYTSNKSDPSDIDIILEFNDTTPLSVILHFQQNRDYYKNKYSVDVLYCLEQNAVGINDLRLYFQYIKPKDLKKLKLPNDARKGLLKVAL